MPLRQLLTSADKTSRELHEMIQTLLIPTISECRDLSRPVRRRTHYPTVAALQTSIHNTRQAAETAQKMTLSLIEHLEVIREHGQREKLSRS